MSHYLHQFSLFIEPVGPHFLNSFASEEAKFEPGVLSGPNSRNVDQMLEEYTDEEVI